jgi:putative membrane protein
MLRPLVAGMAAAIMLTVPAAAQNRAASGQASALSELDTQFLTHAAEDNQASIQLALLAEKKAQYPATQAFARLVINDHALLENLFVMVAKGNGTGIPDGIGPQGQQTATRLQQLQGAAFDTAFLAGEVTGHTDDIMRFQDEEATSQNADVRRLAAVVIPILQQHLALGQALMGSLESTAQTTGAAAGRR